MLKMCDSRQKTSKYNMQSCGGFIIIRNVVELLLLKDKWGGGGCKALDIKSLPSISAQSTSFHYVSLDFLTWRPYCILNPVYVTYQRTQWLLQTSFTQKWKWAAADWDWKADGVMWQRSMAEDSTALACVVCSLKKKAVRQSRIISSF